MGAARFPLVVHATHEAHVKIGGIGAVLDGLLGSPAYNSAVERTIVAGAINVYNHVEMERLSSPGNRLTIIYSSIHGINQASEALANALRTIEARMHVRLLYGRRYFGRAEHEVILVDAQGVAGDVVNPFKYSLWDRWGLDSARYERQWEYSFYLDAGEPLFAAIEAVTAGMSDDRPGIIIAHEWLGLPVVFAAQIHRPERYQTVFYAHEVATARRLVEDNAGHDTRFYNALRAGLAQGQSLDAVFGDQSHYFKHAVIQRAGICNRLFAVGDLVMDELRFLGGVFRQIPISLVYNGVPAPAVDLNRKLISRDLMQQYAENLLGYRPDFIFTHVGRMVVSKAYWRDLRVMEHMDRILAGQGRRAVLFLVSTADPTGRLPGDVFRWESEYGWPVGHRADNGDLRGDEDPFFFHAIEPFHWSSQAIRVVLVNQFGWSRDRCGMRMPEAMTFSDLRIGTDLEFGQSIYEPFGIAQVEPLAAGALSLVSNVCGCVGFVNHAAAGDEFGNLIVADYTRLPDNWHIGSPWDALWVDRSVRDTIEGRSSYEAARQAVDRLPRTPYDLQCLIDAGQQVAKRMSWDVVTNDYLVPALNAL